MLSRSIQLGLFFLVCCGASFAADEPALHQQIDELIRARQIGPVAGPADDATFLRRATLDLAGRIPTRDEVVAFLEDEAPDKRSRQIDRLLASLDYPRNMAVVFDLMLMERRGGKHVSSDDFRAYLEQALAENRSFLDVVCEILAADGTDEKNRPAAAFYLEREVEPNLLTRDVGRVLFGIDLQCAQCHNHPLIDDYHQSDYYGLQAFFLRSSLFRPDAKKPAEIAEQATGEATFKSVFTDREGVIGPLMPGGTELISASLKPTEQYAVPPAKDVRSIPVLSRREQLAAALAESPPPEFNRNIVNRLWAHMFGRGLVHPVDLHHSANPPTHPEVLDLLARRFAESRYDVRWLLRELALTQTYQRSFQLPELQPSIDDALERIAAASAAAEQADEQVAQANAQAESLLEQLDAALAEAKPFREAEAAANAKVAEAMKARDAAQAKVAKRQTDVTARQTQADLLQAAVEATKAATASLKNNKELAAALATIESQHAASAAELKTQQEAIAAEQSAFAATEEALHAASTAADAAIAARVPYEEKVRSLRSQFFAARDEAQQRRMAANLARHDVDYLQTLVAYGQAQQRIAELSQSIAQRNADVAANEAAVANAEIALATTQAEVDQAQAAVAAQQTTETAAATALATVQQTRSKLTASIDSAESALSELSEDAALTQAVALLKTSVSAVDDQVRQAESTVVAAQTELQKLTTSLVAVTTSRDQAQQSVSELKQQVVALHQQLERETQALAETRAERENTWERVVEQSTRRFNATGLTPLTPEQLAWSTLLATGQFDRLQAAAKAKVDKATPPTEESANDPAAVAARKAEITKALEQSLKGPIATFVNLYGAGAGQPQNEFFATAEQSLFAENGGEIRSWLAPGGGNLTQRLIAEENVETLARELYLSLLSRVPTEDEIADVASYLAQHADQKPDAVQQLAWGLLTSVEFRFRY